MLIVPSTPPNQTLFELSIATAESDMVFNPVTLLIIKYEESEKL